MAPRRMLALLVAWLALVASAAPACATLLQADCCPEEVCCVDAPDPGQSMPNVSTRVGFDERQDFDSPDSLIPAAWSAAPAQALLMPGYRFELAPADARDGARVYLRTSRLRL